MAATEQGISDERLVGVLVGQIKSLGDQVTEMFVVALGTAVSFA